MMKSNYNEYDTITLYVKKNKAKEIINHYKAFNWKLEKEKENNRYEDIVDLTFLRLHKIENKDELQLQQVYMEEKLNSLGRLEKYKHSKTSLIGCIFGVLSVGLIVLGVCSLVLQFYLLWLVMGILELSIGFTIFMVQLMVILKLFKKENLEYIKNKQKMENELLNIINTARKLTGVKDE